jgi:hypothetical protein
VRVVNTFLPFPSFIKSARVLDDKRLGQQRNEVRQILHALHGGVGYANHPATIMWRGYHVALVNYGLAVCDEWIGRGHRDSQREIIADFIPFCRDPWIALTPRELKDKGLLPWWFGWKHFHESHRSNLMRKNADHFEWRIWEELGNTDPIDPGLPYVWPQSIKHEWFEKHAGAPARTKRFYSSSPPPTPG